MAFRDSNTAEPTEKAVTTGDGSSSAANDHQGPSSIFSALAAPPYRRFWFGSLASVGATQLLIIGQGVLVFDLSGSEFLLGLAGAVTGIATIVVTLFGGVVADRVNKRRLIILTSLIVSALLFLLGSIDAAGVVRVWHVIVISSLIGIVSGFDFPARLSLFPLLIEQRSQMMSAVALNSILWQATRIIMPAIGGFAIAFMGTFSVFYAGAAGFFAMFLVLLTLNPDEGERSPARNALRQLAGGFQYIASDRLFVVLIPFTYVNHFFGLSYLQLIPVFSDAYGRQDDQALGFLLMSAGIGAVFGTIMTGKIRAAMPAGRVILAGSGFTSLTVLSFALWTHFGPQPVGHENPIISPMFFVSALLIMISAVFNSVFLITSMTVLQLRVPPEFRGRVMGIHSMTFSLIAVGGLFGGGIAQLVNASFAVGLSALVLFSAVLFVTGTQSVVRSLRNE
ncbi:MAG: MFS transporter [Dehalococcoidia bacterium]|nr:MFS transporter [Dehalococcoidia bacterium]